MSTPQALGSTAKSILLTADRGLVVAALSRLPISGSQTWLPTANVYFRSATAQIEADDGVGAAQQGDFEDYLAAASFIHTTDGWAYLGRALHALLQGDVHGAVHLCYYAELRAAIGLLSSEGVYIGNRHTLAATPTVVSKITAAGTHTAAWMCLDVWSGSDRARDLFGAVLRPLGAPLHEWADNMGTGIRPVLESLLTDISFDLESFSDDRKRRNHVSYQPTRVEPDDLPAPDAASLVEDVWTLLEPESRGTFPVLDRLLLRHLAVDVYAPTHPEIGQDGEPTGLVDWAAWSAWLDSVAPAGSANDPYFVSIRETPVDDTRDHALSGAFARSPGAPSTYVREMILRTTILSRLATGACVQLLNDAGMGPADVSAWVSGLGAARALWPDAAPDPMLDLWADAELAKDELVSATKDSYHALTWSMREYLAVLGQAERVAAWSFAS